MRPPLSTDYSSPDRSRAKNIPERAASAPASASKSPALAAYIADMTAELAKLADDAEMPMLCYFLNLARVEADFHAKGVPVPRDRI